MLNFTNLMTGENESKRDANIFTNVTTAQVWLRDEIDY
jgi:hypothetical protein